METRLKNRKNRGFLLLKLSEFSEFSNLPLYEIPNTKTQKSRKSSLTLFFCSESVEKSVETVAKKASQ